MKTEQKNDLSVIIPTYNSKDLLKRCLDSLEKQTFAVSQFEVIVVDDGSTDETKAMLADFQKSTRIDFSFVSIANSGPAAARNTGASHAKYDWIALLDADVIACPNWLQKAAELINQFPSVVGFEGRTKVSERENWTPFTHQTENLNGGRYPTCNLILRKEFCLFNTDYRAAFREDSDLAFSILESGYTIHFSPELLVYHPPLAPSYWKPLKLAKRYYYDALLKRRFPYRYRYDLDCHRLFYFSIPHLKQRLCFVFLCSQITFFIALVSSLFVLPASLFLGTMCLFVAFTFTYRSFKSVKMLKDFLLLLPLLPLVPWVMLTYRILGRFKYGKAPQFCKEQWLKKVGVTQRPHSYDIVMISTADWDYPFWTNKQHLACRLAKNGRRVLYVESLGLRQMTTSKRDLSRIFKRLLLSLWGTRTVYPGLYVWSPLIIPLHKFQCIRVLNQWILTRFIQHFCQKLSFHDIVFWSYNPLVETLANELKPKLQMYHCVDDLKASPNMPVEVLQEAEPAFCRSSDLVVVTTKTLLQSRLQWNRQTIYLPNPCDFEHFHTATTDLPVPSDLQNIPAPRIGFIGALSPYKVDFSLVQEVAQKHPEWSIVLLGMVGEGEPHASIKGLHQALNVHLLGVKPYEELPAYLKEFQVAVLPCPLNDYTTNMFPLKFFEYLAAGVPVVTTALPALEDYSDVSFIAKTPQEFVEALQQAVKCDEEVKQKVQNGIALAKLNTWDKRLESIVEQIESHLEEKEGH